MDGTDVAGSTSQEAYETKTYETLRPDEGGNPVGDFQTGAPELQTAAGQMMDTNELLNDAGRMLAQACDQVEGAWKGVARQAFDNLMGQYSVDFQNMNTALMTIAEQVGASATEYAASEETNQADISAIMNTLDNN